MTKTVRDAALLLDAMATGKDAGDPATGICTPPDGGYVGIALDAGALKGARIGIPRAFYYDPTTPPGASEPRGGLSPAEADLMRRAIAVLEDAGAIVVDPVEIPSIVATNADDNQLLFGNCYDLPQGRGGDAGCSVVMKYGMKRDFNLWLDSLGDAAPVATLTALREFKPGPPAARTRSATTRPSSTSPTRWTSNSTASGTKPTARRTCACAAPKASTRRSKRTTSTRCSSRPGTRRTC